MDPFEITDLFEEDGKTLTPEASTRWRALCLAAKSPQHRIRFNELNGRGMVPSDINRVLRALVNEGFLKTAAGPFGQMDNFNVRKEHLPPKVNAA